MFSVFVFVFAIVAVAVAAAIVGAGIGSDEVVEAFVALTFTIVTFDTFTYIDTFTSSDDDDDDEFADDDDDVVVNINDDAADDGEAYVGNDAVIDFLCSFVACAVEPVSGVEAWRGGTAAKHTYRPRSSVDTLVSTKNFPVCIMVLLLPLSLTHITLPSAVQGMEMFLPLSVTYSWYFIDDVKTVRTCVKNNILKDESDTTEWEDMLPHYIFTFEICA